MDCESNTDRMTFSSVVSLSDIFIFLLIEYFFLLQIKKGLLKCN
jgi:hypothetical protein